MPRLYDRKKPVMGLIILLVMALALAGCGGSPAEEPIEVEEPEEIEEPAEEPEEIEEPADEPEEELQTFTMEEISEFDGQDGRPAYVVVDGLVYDVTDSNMWRGGMHQGQFQAGQDLTDEIQNQSPHGTGVLNRMEVVGRIAD